MDVLLGRVRENMENLHVGEAVLIPTRVPHLCDMGDDCRYSTLRSHGSSWVETAVVIRSITTLHLLRFTLFT